MHIVYCIPSLHSTAGMERIITSKANYLVSLYNHKVTIITTNMQNKKPAFQIDPSIDLIDINIDYSHVNNLNILKKWYEKGRIKKIHKASLEKVLLVLKADIVISTFMEEASFLYKIKDGSKKILEFHFCKGYKNYIADMYNYPFWSKISNLIRSWKEQFFIVPKYDRFVCLTKEDLLNWGGENHQRRFIHNFTSINVSSISSLEEKKVIAVGRLDASKGFDILISLWSIIIKKHFGWKLEIWGDGPDYQRLERLIFDLEIKDYVFLKGRTYDVSKEYRSSSIYAMTSRFEGFGMVLIEAKQHGLPIVCFDSVCGSKEIVHNGVDGYLIKKGDVDSFVLSLEKLMEDEELRQKMGRAQLIDAKRFRPEVIMPYWNNLFIELCS